MWIVNRCVKDIGEAFCIEVASFATRDEAEAYAAEENTFNHSDQVWYFVEKA